MELPHPKLKPLLLGGVTKINLLDNGMPFGVCTDEWIINNPEIFKKIQTLYVNANYDIIYAPTFGANRARLAQFGLENDVISINNQLVCLTKSVSKSCLVAGNISTTGLIAEPFGETTFAELIAIYNEQANALYNSGIDLFIIDAMNSLAEMRAAVLACKKFDKPIYLTIAITEKGKTITGATPLSCLIVLQAMGVNAFGINCSESSEIMLDTLKEISPFATISLIANTNEKLFYEQNQSYNSTDKMQEFIKSLLKIGVSIIDDCCVTKVDNITQMRELIDANAISKHKYDQANDIYLANETGFFALDNDRIEFSELIECSYDMADDFIAAEEDSYDVLWIRINSPEDAKQFSLNAHLAKLPVCFKSDDEVALKSALLLFNGRCLIDSQTSIESFELKKIAEKYGAVIY